MALVLTVAAIGLFFWAAASDVATRRIPNRLVGLLALAGLARLGLDLAAGGGLASLAADLGLALGILAPGALAFRAGVLGGGDVKLLAAGALWLGSDAAWPFLTCVAMAGGALAIGFLLWSAMRRGGPAAARPSLPYGVAIAAGGVLATLAGL